MKLQLFWGLLAFTIGIKGLIIAPGIGYDQLKPPEGPAGKALEVQVDFRDIGVAGVDSNMQTVTLVLTLRAMWRDDGINITKENQEDEKLVRVFKRWTLGHLGSNHVVVKL
jgi:hypothetical protein